MALAGNLISRDNSLYAIGDDGTARPYDQISTSWTCVNGSVSVIPDNRLYPLYYTLLVSPSNQNTVTLSLSNISVPGVNYLNRNKLKIIGHAQVKSSGSLSINCQIALRSTRNTSLFASSSKSIDINQNVNNAILSSPLYVERNKASVITSAVGNGSYVKYTSLNSFSAGDTVFITGNSVSDFDYTAPTFATIKDARPGYFIVDASTVGYSTSSAFAIHSSPNEDEIPHPFPNYAGEDLTGSLSFSFSGHESGQAIYVTIPALVNLNAIFDSWSTRATLTTVPQVMVETDALSEPEYPLVRLLYSLTAATEAVVDKYGLIRPSEPPEQSATIDGDDNIFKSYLVDEVISEDRFKAWLSQFIGQYALRRNIYSNKCADYGAQIKVKCATTSSMNLLTELQATQSCDGVTLNVGDRVLVKNQASAIDNGIYVVQDALPPERWGHMNETSISIVDVTLGTPALGSVTYVTDGTHGFNVGDSIKISGLTPSGLNGDYEIQSVPSTDSLVISNNTYTDTFTTSGDVARAVNTTNPKVIFVRQGDVNRCSKWEAYGDPWPEVGVDDIDFAVKQLGVVATERTSDTDIETDLSDGNTLDGVTLATGDFVLLLGQTDPTENGVYEVPASGSASRASLLPSLVDDFLVFSFSGNTNSNILFTVNADGSSESSATPFAWQSSSEYVQWQLENKYYGYRAGSIGSVEEAAKLCLIGDQDVRVVSEPPFGIRVYTLKDETLGVYSDTSEITESEILAQAIEPVRPMGFSITVQALDTFDAFVIGTSTIGTGRIG